MSLYNAIAEFFGLYFPIILGVVSQVVFLSFPVALQNWHDDDLYALTYVGFQMFMAAVIFIAVPIFLDAFVIGWWRGLAILLGVMAIAALRVYRMVPLEGSFPVILPKEVVKPVEFLDFNVPLRTRALAELRATSREEERRFQEVRGMLSRRHVLMELSSRGEN